nr:LysR family transcriptional regulator substrate-binding protein [Comamonas aquatica]
MGHQAQTAHPQVTDAPAQGHRRHLQCQASRGTVHIGCATAASLFIMPRVMAQLLVSAMKLTVHVHEGETGYLLQRLRERSLDLVICRSQFAAPELQNQEVMNEPLRVALPPQHPLCGQAQIALGALRAERFLLHSSLLGTGISDMLLRACQEAGFTPEVAYWGVETLPMLLMVQKGLGVAFAPDSFAQLGMQGLPVLVPLADAKLRTHLNMIWPRGHVLPPAAERLKELILAQCLPPPTCAQAKGPAQVPGA